MTREEHLQWAKDRAIEYADKGDSIGAWTSFVSDMNKHDDTRDHIALEMGTLQILGGHLATAGQVKHFIEGFN